MMRELNLVTDILIYFYELKIGEALMISSDLEEERFNAFEEEFPGI